MARELCIELLGQGAAHLVLAVEHSSFKAAGAAARDPSCA
jgi:hypothetical protein